jgi:hypothetical protein
MPAINPIGTRIGSAAMRSPFILFRRSAMPRWMLALAMLLNVLSGGMPMPSASGGAITRPAMIALALLNPDICAAPAEGQAPPVPAHHHRHCLLCPVCMAHGPATLSLAVPAPPAPAGLIGRVGIQRLAGLSAGPATGAARARGPPALSA